LDGESDVEVVVVVWSGLPPPVVTAVFVETVTEGIKARTGAVIVSTTVFAGLWATYLCAVMNPALNVKVFWGLVKKSRLGSTK
jgi:hypothetical protein